MILLDIGQTLFQLTSLLYDTTHTPFAYAYIYELHGPEDFSNFYTETYPTSGTMRLSEPRVGTRVNQGSN